MPTIYISGPCHSQRCRLPADARVAMKYLESALRIDPNYAAAHALLSWCHEWCFARGGLVEADKLAAIRHARAALVSSTDDATALAIAGFVTTMLSKDHAAGLTATERALQQNPSCATAMYLGSSHKRVRGSPGCGDRSGRAGVAAKRLPLPCLPGPLCARRSSDLVRAVCRREPCICSTGAAAQFQPASALLRCRGCAGDVRTTVRCQVFGQRWAADGRDLPLPDVFRVDGRRTRGQACRGLSTVGLAQVGDTRRRGDRPAKRTAPSRGRCRSS